MTQDPQLRIALGQYDCGWQDPPASLAQISRLASGARAGGADLLVLPEMCTTGFTMDPQAHAEHLDGSSIEELARIARMESIHLIAGVATRGAGESGETFFNSSLHIDDSGVLLAEYRKQRLFAFAGEQNVYQAGTAPVIVTIRGVRLAMFICFDLRFPELFRAIASQVDGIVVIANWPVTRLTHWDTLLRARAIESQAFVIGVNRTGSAGGLEYTGGSIVYDPWGEPLAAHTQGQTGPVLVDLDASTVTGARQRFPLVADERRC